MAIAYVDSVNLGNNGGSGTFTASYTVGTGTNRLLVLVVQGASIPTADPGITAYYAGNTMNLAFRIDSGNAGGYNNRNLYFYYLVNPPSGANNVVVAGAHDYVLAVAADYAGVNQTTPINITNFSVASPGGTSITVSVTPTVPNCWVVTGSVEYVLSGAAPGAGANLTQRAYGTAFGEPQLCDSNGPEGVTTNSYTTTSSTGTYGGAAIIGVAFAPDAAYTGPTTGSLTQTQQNQTLAGVGGYPLAWALIAHTFASGNETGTVYTPAIDTTGADLIVVAAGSAQPSLVGSLSDNFLNNFTIRRFNGPTLSVGLMWSRPTTVGPGHVFTWSNPNYGGIEVAAYKGSSSNPNDQVSSNNGTTTVQNTSITPSVSNALLVTGFCANGNYVSIDSGFAVTDQFANTSVTAGGGMAALVQTTAAAIAPTWVNDAFSGGQMSVAMASFKGSLTGPVSTTGNLAVTQASQTLLAAGTVPVVGTLAVTQANQALVAVASTTVRGALAVTGAPATIAATGSVIVRGTLAAGQAAQSLAAIGGPVAGGTLAATQANQTMVSAGRVFVSGGLSATQASQTIVATGALPITGGLIATQAGQILVATGTPLVGGALAATQAGQTIVAAGRSLIGGALTASQAAQTLSGSGSALTGIGGALNIVQAPQALSSAGTVVGLIGSLAVVQANQTVLAVGAVQTLGTLTVAQAAQTLVAVGMPLVGGTLSATQASQTLVATARSTVVGTLSVTQADETLSATGNAAFQVATGGLTATQAPQALAATATGPTISGTLTVTQANQPLTAVAAARVAGVLTATQADQAVSASAAVPLSGFLNLTQANQTLTAAGGVGLTAGLGLTQANQTLSAFVSIFVPPTSDIIVDVPGVVGPGRVPINVPVVGKPGSNVIVNVPI